MSPALPTTRTSRPLLATALAAGLALAACGTADPDTTGATAPEATAPVATTQPQATEPRQTPEPTEEPEPAGPVSLAFVGDIHATGSAQRVITDGLGQVGDLLAEHDVAVGNLETAILTEPSAASPAPKTYTFGAPPALLDALHANGLDAVTLANNHGMDFGAEGLRQTLAVADSAPVALLGAGRDVTSAYAPWTTDVRGTRVSVVAATDVLDSFAIDTWPATEDRPGLASSKGSRETLLLDAVTRARADADVLAVFLHWGVERQTCPTERQRELAAKVAAAGADVIVGSHAHVVQPVAEVDGALVAYGLGNFVWYAREGTAGARTGVLSVEVGPDGTSATWHDARIRAGIPELTGEAGPPPSTC